MNEYNCTGKAELSHAEEYVQVTLWKMIGRRLAKHLMLARFQYPCLTPMHTVLRQYRYFLPVVGIKVFTMAFRCNPHIL